MNGKGSRPRPIRDWKEFSENWDMIFNKEPRRKDGGSDMQEVRTGEEDDKEQHEVHALSSDRPETEMGK